MDLLIGLNGAEWVVLGGGGLLGEEVKERGFADVGKTNYTHLERILGPPEAYDIGCLGGDGFLGRHVGGWGGWVLVLRLYRSKIYLGKETKGARIMVSQRGSRFNGGVSSGSDSGVHIENLDFESGELWG